VAYIIIDTITRPNPGFQPYKYFPFVFNMDSILFVASNKIFFDFVFFQQYANRDTYPTILNSIVCAIQQVLSKYPTFEMHVSLYSFSMSALTKHKDFIQMFSERQELYESSFTDLHIYFTPNIIDSIMKVLGKIFSNPYRPKMHLHSKQESEELLTQVFSTL